MNRWTLYLMIPLNLLLLVWVWIGRIVFGVGGWFFLILLPVVAVLALALLATTILGFTQRGRGLTRLQAGAQLAMWLGMLGFGTFLPDFGDTEDSYISALSQLLGTSDAVMSVSWVLTIGFAAVTVIAYVVLLAGLVLGRRQAADPGPTLSPA